MTTLITTGPAPGYVGPEDGNTIPIIPNSPPVVTPRQLNYVTADAYARVYEPPAIRQTPISGIGELLEIIFGEDQIGAKITLVADYQGDLILRCEWCQGGIDAVVSIKESGAAYPAGVTWTHYTGSQVTPDALLVTVCATKGITYTDTLAGVCYSVGRFPPGLTTGFPRPVAQIRGMLCKKTAAGAAVWTDDPIWHGAWILDQRLGASIDWANFAAAAAAATEVLVGGEKKRTVGITLSRESDASSWLELLFDYAGCWLNKDGANYTLIPDAPASTAMTFDKNDFRDGALTITSRNIRKTPNRVRVVYTDRSVTPWRESYQEASTGAGDWVSEVKMPGIFRASQAKRTAVERLNEFRLNALRFEFVTKEKAVQLQRGDVIEISHDGLGVTSAKMRIEAPTNVEEGRFGVAGYGYTSAKYSSVVVADPSGVDPSIASPLNVPVVTILSISEVSAATETGAFTTQIRLLWSFPSWIYFRDFRVLVYDEGQLVQEAFTGVSGFTSNPVAIGHNYRVVVFGRSSIAQGAGSAAQITINGTAAAAPGEMLWGVYALEPEAPYVSKAKQYGRGDTQRHTHVVDSASPFTSEFMQLDQISGNVSAWGALDSYIQIYGGGGVAPLPGEDYTPLAPTAKTLWHSDWVEPFGGNSKFCRVVAEIDYRSIYSAPGALQIATDIMQFVGGPPPGFLVFSYGDTAIGWMAQASAALTTSVSVGGSLPTGAAEITTPAKISVFTKTESETKSGTSSASAAVTITCTNNFAKLKGVPKILINVSSPRFPVVDNFTYGAVCTFDVRIFDNAGTLTATAFEAEIEGTI